MDSPPAANKISIGGEFAQQIVLGICRGEDELVVDIAAELHHRDPCSGELFFADQTFERLGGRVSPFHELRDAGGWYTDHLGHDHHGRAIGHCAHPFDPSVT